jgi:hypothetical protein
MQGFFRDVMRDKVSVKKLVTMNAEEMHSALVPTTKATISNSTSTSILAAADSTSTSDISKGVSLNPGGDFNYLIKF